MFDTFDCTAGDGCVELTLEGRGLCITFSVDEAERIGCALLRAAGVADWKATDDDDDAGTPFVVTDGEPAF